MDDAIDVEILQKKLDSYVARSKSTKHIYLIKRDGISVAISPQDDAHDVDNASLLATSFVGYETLTHMEDNETEGTFRSNGTQIYSTSIGDYIVAFVQATGTKKPTSQVKELSDLLKNGHKDPTEAIDSLTSNERFMGRPVEQKDVETVSQEELDGEW
jgi:hypothetical protein